MLCWFQVQLYKQYLDIMMLWRALLGPSAMLVRTAMWWPALRTALWWCGTGALNNKGSLVTTAVSLTFTSALSFPVLKEIHYSCVYSHNNDCQITLGFHASRLSYTVFFVYYVYILIFSVHFFLDCFKFVTFVLYISKMNALVGHLKGKTVCKICFRSQ